MSGTYNVDEEYFYKNEEDRSWSTGSETEEKKKEEKEDETLTKVDIITIATVVTLTGTAFGACFEIGRYAVQILFDIID